jgi:pSer/pThr/pTyr-binding forkhead associated (FHA) protein/DNA-binding CsgD family transcriptional regulator
MRGSNHRQKNVGGRRPNRVDSEKLCQVFYERSTYIDPGPSSAMRQFVLVEQHARGTPRRFTLGHGTHFIGRSETCHFSLSEDDISRRHASISLNDGKLELVDLNSRNGTFVDNQKVKTRQVIAGQLIRLGATTFLLACLDPNGGAVDNEETKSRRHVEIPKGPDSAVVLTPAQKCVYEFLLKGLKDKEIAKKLRIGASTVHTHVRAIFRSLNVHSRPELLARRLGSKTRASES